GVRLCVAGVFGVVRGGNSPAAGVLSIPPARVNWGPAIGNPNADVAATRCKQDLTESSADASDPCRSRLDRDIASSTGRASQCVTAITALKDEACAIASRLTRPTRIAALAAGNPKTFGGVGAG